jgi:uncharacterized integral membrane protein
MHGRWQHSRTPLAPREAPSPERGMRFVYIALIVVVTFVVLSFKFQNLQSATLSLYTASVTLPMSVLVIAIYVLGMLTGASLLALAKSWVAGARRA